MKRKETEFCRKNSVSTELERQNSLDLREIERKGAKKIKFNAKTLEFNAKTLRRKDTKKIKFNAKMQRRTERKEEQNVH